MHPYLTRLTIRPELQDFFRPFYSVDELGNMVFPYGKELEHFGFGFHRVPVSAELWMAGNLNFSQVRVVILCASALDAVSWLNKKAFSFANTQNLLFLSTGAAVRQEHINYINWLLKGKECCLIYSGDLLGRITDLKIAAAIRGIPIEIYLGRDEMISTNFRLRTFSFSQESFSLSAFERAAKYRFGIRTEKPKGHLSFFDELKAEALFTF